MWYSWIYQDSRLWLRGSQYSDNLYKEGVQLQTKRIKLEDLNKWYKIIYWLIFWKKIKKLLNL